MEKVNKALSSFLALMQWSMFGFDFGNVVMEIKCEFGFSANGYGIVFFFFYLMWFLIDFVWFGLITNL